MTLAGESGTDRLAHAKRRLAVPAGALIALSSLSLMVLWTSLAFTIWLYVSGAVDDLPDTRGVTRETQHSVRTAWNLAMQGVHGIVLFGAVRLHAVRSLGLARAACIAACIPCCGPCFVLGIPFGIWGLTLLADPEIKAAFRD